MFVGGVGIDEVRRRRRREMGRFREITEREAGGLWPCLQGN